MSIGNSPSWFHGRIWEHQFGPDCQGGATALHLPRLCWHTREGWKIVVLIDPASTIAFESARLQVVSCLEALPILLAIAQQALACTLRIIFYSLISEQSFSKGHFNPCQFAMWERFIKELEKLVSQILKV